MAEEAVLGRREVAGRPDAPVRGNNRNRILEASLALFNERGTSAVSTNTIADHLGISPGNLYYHFANKEQIIRELWSQMEAQTAPVVEVPADGSLLPAEGLARFLVAGMDSLFGFRFLFRDIDDLNARDPDLGQAFRAEMEWARRRLVGMFDSLIDHGVMAAPAGPGDLDRLSVNVQLVFLNWMRFLTVVRDKAPTGHADLAEGPLQAFLMLEPYLDRDYARRARAYLEGRLGATTAKAKRPAAKRLRRGSGGQTVT